MNLRAPAFAGVVSFAAACSAANDAVTTPESAYLTSATARRDVLVGSLVSHTNGYARTRLDHYATGNDADWDRLPEWNPRTEPVMLEDLGTDLTRPLGEDAHAVRADVDAGEEAFFHYPVQLASRAALAVKSRATAERYGFWLDEARGVGGLVRVQVADGSVKLAFTCASCHASRPAGVGGAALAPGLGNAGFDLGALTVDAAPNMDDAHANALSAWGPGRVDVTTTAGIEPVRIPDLRPVRWLSHLHHAAAVRQADVIALAVRLETLIITSHDEALRPPREISLALAKYIWSLAGTLPEPTVTTPEEQRGQALFNAECTRCHGAPGFTGPPVALETVGTDPVVGRSANRGTGTYRVPSLRGVNARGALMHDAAAPSLDVMFDPDRLTAGFARGARPGPIPGHTWGLGLSGADRSSLLAFLRRL